MGNKQSTTLTNINDIFTENLTNIMTKNVSNSSVNCSTNQANTISIGEDAIITNCPLTMTNQALVTCDLGASFNVSDTSQLTNLINQAIDETATSTNTSVQDFLSSAVSSQETTQNVTNKFKTTISNNITKEDISNCMANSVSIQNNSLNFGKGVKFTCSTGQEISTGNNLSVAVSAQCLSNVVSNILSANTETNSILSTSTSTQSSEQKGLGGVLQSLISTYGYIVIVIIVIVGLVLISGGYFLLKVLLSPAGQQSITKATEAGIDIAKVRSGKI
jgi:hypothetical protein